MRMIRWSFAIAPIVFPTATVHAQEIGDRFLTLISQGKPSATIVLPEDSASIWNDVANLLLAPVERWGGAKPRIIRLAADAELPGGDLVLIGTPQTSNAIRALADDTESLVSRVPLGAAEGFAIESREAGSVKQVIIAGRSPRGAYNGVIVARDFALDATRAPAGQADVFLYRTAVRRSPQMPQRGTYCLSIYGVAMKYTTADWKKIIDRFADDGMNLLCFWLSGHHPSKKYPQVFDIDGSKGTRLTVDGVTELIRYCHDRGIRFYIAGGVFAWTASHYLGQGRPEVMAVKAGGLCPSNAFARQAQKEHFLEMYDTWPEADGFMFEIRDEQGECQCDTCQQKLDEFGSKRYGQAEITWLQEFAREAWKRNDKLRFLWLLGYAEHTHDVYYYEQIRHMNDPRFEWLDPRVSLDGNGKWVLPGPGGTPRPFAFFSRQIAHWDPYYRHRMEHLIHWANRVANEGLNGYVPAFEPGFGTGSYYWDQIPLPVDLLPYTLTGLTYREMTWDPGTTLDELKQRIKRRYFSPQTPARFVEDMIYLHNFSFDHWETLSFYAKDRYGYSGEMIPQLTIGNELKRVQTIADAAQKKSEAEALGRKFRQLAKLPEHLQRMEEIGRAIAEARPRCSPKAAEGFALLTRMIDDTRRLYARAVPQPAQLADALAQLAQAENAQ